MKCPICNEEINRLELTARGVMCYHLSLDVDGDVQWEERQFVPNEQINEFECPECGASLFHKESEAVAFLKGE